MFLVVLRSLPVPFSSWFQFKLRYLFPGTIFADQKLGRVANRLLKWTSVIFVFLLRIVLQRRWFCSRIPTARSRTVRFVSRTALSTCFATSAGFTRILSAYPAAVACNYSVFSRKIIRFLISASIPLPIRIAKSPSLLYIQPITLPFLSDLSFQSINISLCLPVHPLLSDSALYPVLTKFGCYFHRNWMKYRLAFPLTRCGMSCSTLHLLTKVMLIDKVILIDEKSFKHEINFHFGLIFGWTIQRFYGCLSFTQSKNFSLTRFTSQVTCWLQSSRALKRYEQFQ